MLEALMAARKATRTFDRVQWGAPVPKSSLDGQRESVIPENLYEQVKSRPEQEAWFRHRYGARPAERLCGVSLMKRLGKLPPQFEVYSTSHVAALPLLLTIPSAHQNDLDAYIERLLSLSFDSEGLYGSKKTTNSIFFHSKDEAKRPVDGHILFAERLSDYLNSSASRDENKNRLRAAETALTRFLNAATGGERPLPYYAILLADGDRMGEAIDRLTTIEEHQAISKALSSFAKDADVIVTSHYGSLIYAGGDDVLALVPLHTVLQCARSLADAFFQALEPFGGEVQPANTPTSVDQQTNEPKSHPSPSADSKVASESTKPATAAKSSPTLSVGIVVAHHIEPLEDALAGARAAEREAKSVQGKNALAVTVMKRSGSDTTVAGRWSAPTGEIAGGSINSPKTGKSAESIKVSLGAGGMDRRLTWIIDLHCQDRIPDGAAFDLRDLALRLPFSGENSETIRVARRLEAVRILKRKKMEEPLLKELLQVMSEDDVEMETLAMEMIVARIFADAKTQATAHPHPSAPQPA
jgi:CRISPR-associated protein Cmr2